MLLDGPITRLARSAFRVCTSIRHDIHAGVPASIPLDEEPVGFAISDAFPPRILFSNWDDFQYLWRVCPCRVTAFRDII